MKTILRIVFAPLLLFIIVAQLMGLLAWLMVWLFDPTYDHKLACKHFYILKDFWPFNKENK